LFRASLFERRAVNIFLYPGTGNAFTQHSSEVYDECDSWVLVTQRSPTPNTTGTAGRGRGGGVTCRDAGSTPSLTLDACFHAGPSGLCSRRCSGKPHTTPASGPSVCGRATRNDSRYCCAVSAVCSAVAEYSSWSSFADQVERKSPTAAAAASAGVS